MKNKIIVIDHSTLTGFEYILEHIAWVYMIFIVYKRLFFLTLDPFSVKTSKFILLCSLILASIVGIIIRWNRNMTTKAVISDSAVGMGIYCMLAYAKYYKIWIKSLMILCALVIFVVVFCEMNRNYKGRKLSEINNAYVRRVIASNRILNAISYSGFALSIFLIIMMLPLLYNNIFNNGILFSTGVVSYDKVLVTNEENPYCLEKNLDTISKLRTDEAWKALSLDEKLVVLQTLCNCEAAYLGLDHEVTASVSDLSEYTLGSYNESERNVIFDVQFLEESSAEEALEVTLHEMFHAWEHCLVRFYIKADSEERKMLIFARCPQYLKEMQKYTSGGDDETSFFKYYTQAMEEDSRAYAAENVKVYYAEIDYYLSKREGGGIAAIE